MIEMRTMWVSLITVVLGVPAYAVDTPFVGPRSVGMGGTGIASTADANAAFVNPAMFAWPERFRGYDDSTTWSVSWIDAQAGVSAVGGLTEILEDLGELDIDRITNDLDITVDDVQQIIGLASSLARLIFLSKPAAYALITMLV